MISNAPCPPFRKAGFSMTLASHALSRPALPSTVLALGTGIGAERSGKVRRASKWSHAVGGFGLTAVAVFGLMLYYSILSSTCTKGESL